MKKIKEILVFAVIAAGIFFSSTTINTEKSEQDLASLMAVETADAKMVFFGCGQFGTGCGGKPNCKSVIFSSNRCAGWVRGQ